MPAVDPARNRKYLGVSTPVLSSVGTPEVAGALDVEGRAGEIGAEVDAPHVVNVIQAAAQTVASSHSAISIAESCAFTSSGSDAGRYAGRGLAAHHQDVLLAGDLLQNPAAEGGIAFNLPLDPTRRTTCFPDRA